MAARGRCGEWESPGERNRRCSFCLCPSLRLPLSVSLSLPPSQPLFSFCLSFVWAVLTLCFSSLKFSREANCRRQTPDIPLMPPLHSVIYLVTTDWNRPDQNFITSLKKCGHLISWHNLRFSPAFISFAFSPCYQLRLITLIYKICINALGCFTEVEKPDN